MDMLKIKLEMHVSQFVRNVNMVLALDPNDANATLGFLDLLVIFVRKLNNFGAK